MNTRPHLATSCIALLSVALLTALSCGTGTDAEAFIDDARGEGEEAWLDDELTTTISDDDLNGLWQAVARPDAGVAAPLAVLESWAPVGIRLTYGGTSYALTRSVDTLSQGTQVQLLAKPNDAGVADDTLEGTIGGQPVVFKRDTSPKPPQVIALPQDRPYRDFLTQVLMPAAQVDRESYTVFHADQMAPWLRSCELYRRGSWQRKYMKGETWSEQSQALQSVIGAVNNIKTTPRRMTKEFKFSNALQKNLKPDAGVGLAMSTFGMYFSTAAGRGVRLPIAADSTAYFITDKPSRQTRIGVVAMATPTHGPLASTFGRQLLDLGAMPQADTTTYARTMMELLVSSDPRRAQKLSPVGRSAITDWYAVMAIEDYRGVAFGWPDLGWGYNMTSVQFYGLLVRALARPGAIDASGNAIKGQVIVGSELRPGDPSYADVLNHGNDMQEYADMSRLKTLATAYLRAKHPELTAAVDAAFSKVVPLAELDAWAKADLFHFVCAALYDNRGRTSVLSGANATAAIDSVVALFEVLQAESPQFEAWLLTQGLLKSNVPAPVSDGF